MPLTAGTETEEYYCAAERMEYLPLEPEDYNWHADPRGPAAMERHKNLRRHPTGNRTRTSHRGNGCMSVEYRLN